MSLLLALDSAAVNLKYLKKYIAHQLLATLFQIFVSLSYLCMSACCTEIVVLVR